MATVKTMATARAGPSSHSWGPNASRYSATRNRTNTSSWSTRWTPANPTEASGSTTRGKRTLRTRLALPTTAPVASRVAELKKFQIRNPDMNRTANQGTLFLRKNVNTRVNTARYSSGLASDQMNPRAEFLYLTLRSLRTSSVSSSRRTRDWAAARASAACWTWAIA